MRKYKEQIPVAEMIERLKLSDKDAAIIKALKEVKANTLEANVKSK